MSFERTTGEEVEDLFGMGSHQYTKDGTREIVL